MGISRQLRSYYVAEGLLQPLARGLYRRPVAALDGGAGEGVAWEQVVASLQLVMGWDVVVGGATALDLQGYAHYLRFAQNEVHLYADKAPAWLKQLDLPVRLVVHRSSALFSTSMPDVAATSGNGMAKGFVAWRSPRGLLLTLSAPERAILEVLADVPRTETLHNARVLMDGLAHLRPALVAELLRDCKSVKAKRLFLALAERANHAWLRHLDKSGIDLGSGKRVLEKGGKLDATYLITLPEDLDGHQ